MTRRRLAPDCDEPEAVTTPDTTAISGLLDRERNRGGMNSNVGMSFVQPEPFLCRGRAGCPRGRSRDPGGPRHLELVQPSVRAAGLAEHGVRTAFAQAPVIDDEDRVCVLHGG